MSSGQTGDSWRVLIVSATAMIAARLEQQLAARGHKVVGMLTAPGPRGRRTDGYKEIAQLARPGLDVIVSNYPNRWADMVRPMKPDLLLCATFNWKLPPELLDVPRLGAINGHDSYLPLHRGRNATGWNLRYDMPLGVTVHYMSADFDTGPIVAQTQVPLTDDDYSAEQVAPKLMDAAARTFELAFDRLEAGVEPTPQDESQATYAGGAFEPEWREIDWSDPGRHNFIKIRSWYGARDVPRGAFGEIDGQRCLITTARLADVESDAAPGTVLERRDDGSVIVQCGGGRALEILDWSTIDDQEE
jgi:methionyl-tRNA formyltransferase